MNSTVQILNSPQVVQRVTTHQPITQLHTVQGVSNVRVASPTVLNRSPHGGVVIKAMGATQVISGIRPVSNSMPSIRSVKIVPNSVQAGSNTVRLANASIATGITNVGQNQYKLLQPASQIVSSPITTTPGRPVLPGTRAVRILTVGSSATSNFQSKTSGEQTYTIAKLPANPTSQISNKVALSTVTSRVTISTPKNSITTLNNQYPVVLQPSSVVGGVRMVGTRSQPIVVSTPNRSGSKFLIQQASAQSLAGRTTARQVLAATGFQSSPVLKPFPINTSPIINGSPSQHSIITHRTLNNNSQVLHSPSIHGPKSGSRPGTPINVNNRFVKQVTDKDVSRMWFNNDIKLKQMNRSNSVSTNIIYMYIDR